MAETQKPARPSRLGRGLSALMAAPVAVEPPSKPLQADPATPPAGPAGVAAPEMTGEGLRYLPVHAIRPNRHQPRQRFDEASLQSLADSIRSDGLMQPIVVREDPPGGFELVAGERRWRAAQLAGLTALPALVRELSDRQMAELALIENLQREDLNPIDRAEAFHRLATAFGMSHDEIAERVGLDRSSVANLIRLLSLAPGVQQLVRDELLSMGQARALLAVEQASQQEALAKQAVREGMSVRDVEAAVRRLGKKAGGPGAETPPVNQRASHFKDLEQVIGQQLGTRVALAPGRKKGAGKLTIEFYSLDQFDTLLDKLGVRMEE